MNKTLLATACLATSLLALPRAGASTITEPGVIILVADPGNQADTSGFGAVGYTFAISKYEVSISQYTEFLNSVAALGDPHGLYHASMATDLNIAGIARTGSGTVGSPYSYTPIGNGNRPIAYVSWFDAARLANWVNNGATSAASTETGAYTLNGQTTGSAPARNPGASWWIPTQNEWYKAAYYKGGGTNAGYWQFATQSDTAPGNTIGSGTNQANYNNGVFAVTQVSGSSSSQNYLTVAGAFSGSPSAYGTFDQGGNLREWNDLTALAGTDRGVGGGGWSSSLFEYEADRVGFLLAPTEESPLVGIRLATVPEPSTVGLAVAGLAGAAWTAYRQRSCRRRRTSRAD